MGVLLPVGRVTIPRRIVHAVDDNIATEHPREAGGFLACERRDGRLHATGHVPLPNEAADPERRFVATVDERAPPEPRICYHSHTSASTPSGLTDIDRRMIPERYALVVFAPRGDPHSYRLFRRGLLRWRELPVGHTRSGPGEWHPLPRLS
jgi:proteasome lid subunit RPN8/RPN11